MTVAGIGVLLLGLLSVAGGPAAAADSAGLPPPAISMEGRRLSVRLTKVPLAQVLELILQRSAAEITVLGDTDGEVTAEFDDLPLEEGLRRLLGPRSYVLVYSGEDAAPASESRVKAVTAAVGTGARETLSRQSARTLPPPTAAQAEAPDPVAFAAVESGGVGTSVGQRAKYLEGVLATSTDSGLRAAALKMLSVVSPASLSAIAEAARMDPSTDVRRRALQLLVSQAPTEGIVRDTLRAVARTDPDTGIREQARVLVQNLDPGGEDP